MNARRRDPLPSRVIVGLIIVAIGALLLAGNLGWLDARDLLRDGWPLALVFAGIAMLRDPRHRHGHPWAWVMITVGLWIFADNIGWVAWSIWQVIVPGILLFVGGTLIWRTLNEQSRGERAEEARETGEEPLSKRSALGDAPDDIRATAFMSYSDLHPSLQPFRGGELNAVMGGIKLDLRDTRMDGDTATLDAFAFWGGIEILVPPDWIVTSKVTTIAGGFVDSRRPSKVIPTKTLIIRGFNLMSGIEVKS